MKKTTRIFSLLLGVLMIFSLASCGKTVVEKPFEPEDAASLWNKIYETMNAVENYNLTVKIEMTYYSLGKKFEVNEEIINFASNAEEYIESKTVIKCQELSYEENIVNVSAYHDGKMYSSTKNSKYDQKFCSPMTFEEYREANYDETLDNKILGDCTNSEFSKKEDGTWNIKFSGYTKKAITKLMKTTQISYEDLGADVLDMEVNIVADADFRIKTIKTDFSFDVDENTTTLPRFSMIEEYSSFNEAKFDTQKLKAEEYTQVDDVRVLSYVEDGIKVIQDAATGKFTLDISNSTTILGQTETTTEKDIVSYGKKNGAYYYDVEAKTDEQTIYLKHESGNLTIEVGGEKQVQAQNEKDAKAQIDGFIDSAKYNSMAVTSIEKKSDGVYLLKIANFDVSLLQASYEGSGIELKSGTQEITVTMTDKSITKIESKIDIDAVYNYEGGSEKMTLSGESVVTVEKVESALGSEEAV
ncbi:MAG: hypothetical protein E7480_08290 [Ruminococcaceae bacterium]|nr:hypothetical protein [Oscillospiraceae bacterium]